VREPPDESSVSRVRVPLAKPRTCGATCPSDHPVVQLRENARAQPGRWGFDSHRECQFRRAVEFGLSATVLTDQRVQIPPQPPFGWVPNSLLARRFLYRAESRRLSNSMVECRPIKPEAAGSNPASDAVSCPSLLLCTPAISTGRRIGLSLHKREVAGSSPASGHQCRSSSGVERVTSQFALYPSCV
jgi:hypothetical protein